MTVRLERMRWWHVADVMPLEAALFSDEPWSARTFWSELGQVGTRHYVVAIDAGRVIGYAGLCDYPDEAWVQTMAVHPTAQGKGVGTLLLADLLAEAERRNQRAVALEVRADNPTAQRLYARHGFVQTGVRRGYYQPSNVDALVLTRRT
ncbi:MAG: ribosomal protein S18P -alanine acetyltransferase [Frankiales bacterium]|nr:ribosomal protein S18P -alanine acetyltransferase [Frankiales bacterium]